MESLVETYMYLNYHIYAPSYITVVWPQALMIVIECIHNIRYLRFSFTFLTRLKRSYIWTRAVNTKRHIQIPNNLLLHVDRLVQWQRIGAVQVFLQPGYPGNRCHQHPVHVWRRLSALPAPWWMYGDRGFVGQLPEEKISRNKGGFYVFLFMTSVDFFLKTNILV